MLHACDRLIILQIDCISVFIVYCFLFVFSSLSLYHSLMNKAAHIRRVAAFGRETAAATRQMMYRECDNSAPAPRAYYS